MKTVPLKRVLSSKIVLEDLGFKRCWGFRVEASLGFQQLRLSSLGLKPAERTV